MPLLRINRTPTFLYEASVNTMKIAEIDFPRLAVWLGRLGCGYGLALAYLARVLDVEGDIDSRLESVLAEVH